MGSYVLPRADTKSNSWPFSRHRVLSPGYGCLSVNKSPICNDCVRFVTLLGKTLRQPQGGKKIHSAYSRSSLCHYSMLITTSWSNCIYTDCGDRWTYQHLTNVRVPKYLLIGFQSWYLSFIKFVKTVFALIISDIDTPSRLCNVFQVITLEPHIETCFHIYSKC